VSDDVLRWQETAALRTEVTRLTSLCDEGGRVLGETADALAQAERDLADARAEVAHLRAEINRLATATSAALNAPRA
jgi:hypothetical protein